MDNKIRIMTLKFSTEQLKKKVIRNANELEVADDKFKRISLAHDLTPSQRAQLKEVYESDTDSALTLFGRHSFIG